MGIPWNEGSVVVKGRKWDWAWLIIRDYGFIWGQIYIKVVRYRYFGTTIQ